MNYKTIVINLDRRADRYQEFLNNYTFGPHIRFSGFDGKHLIGSNALTDLQKSLLLKLKNHIGVPDKHLPGVFGCWLSHFGVWNQLINDIETDAYLIFEDDMRPSKSFNKNLKKILSSIDNTFDIYYIGGRFKDSFTPNNLSDWNEVIINGTTFYSAKNPGKCGVNHDRGLFSYILTKEGAKRLISRFPEYNKEIPAVDEWINKDVEIRKKVCDFFPHITWSPKAYKSDIR
jgi:GR25 family glycosyltransferase involved in LPS biosynthesis